MKPLSGLDINITDSNPFAIKTTTKSRFKDDLKSRIIKYLPIISSQW
jgi:hypothetical protein